MLGKNNRQMYQNLHADQHQHWALRKLSLGLTSVLVSVSIYAGTNATKAEAASNPADSTTSETEITAGTASTSGSTAILKTSQGGSSTTSTANSPAASTANSSATVASNNRSATVASQATSSANATSQNANSSTKQASSASQTSTTNLNVADLTSDQANATANLTTNLAVSSSANTPNVITPSYQDTTFTLPEKDNSNAEINITKPTDYPQVDWISNDYWIFEEVHEWTAVGYRHDYYVAVKADGSSTQTGTVYLFDSRSKQMTTVEKGQFVQLAGNDGDRFYNSGRTISFLNINQTSGSYYKHYNVLYSLYNKYADNEQPWYNSVSEFIPILGPLVVHYQDQTTGQEIISSTEIAMMTGNSYDVTNPPKIDGYTYVGVKNNTTGHISNYNDATVGQQWDEHFGFSQLSKNSYDVYTTYTYEGKNTEGVGKFKLETYVDGLIYHTDEMDSMNPVRIMLPDGGYIDLANPLLQGENDVTFLYKKNPDDVETTTESKTVKRTIEYIDKTTGEAIPSNLAKPVEQDVTLTRTKSTNKTTGKVTYGDWTVASGSWDKVVSPDLTNYGYTAPDKASVAAVTVDGNTENSDVKVYYGHATTTITPDNPQKPDTPINPNDPDSPKYTKDQTDVTRDASQTIHYTGAGDKTPSDNVQTQKDAFTRTVTIDKVTGKTISTTPWTGSKTFDQVTSPAVADYHADKKVAGVLTATPANPNVRDTVTYTKDSDDVENTTESKEVTRTINYVDKKTGKAIPSSLAATVKQVVTLTRTKSTNKTTGKVTYGDWTVKSGSWNEVVSPDLTNFGYTAPDKASVVAVTVDGSTENSDVTVYYDHATTTITPDNPQKPDTPINPNDPNSPKYTEDQTDVTKDASQTIHYKGAGDKTPSDNVQTQKNAFTRTVTVDKVTGEAISSTPWTGTKTFGTVDTPVVDGYHADKKVAGGLTATPDNPNVSDTVTYAANGKIIPVDPDGNKIPNVPNPTYPTDPTDPTKVVPDEPVPDIPGYTPETPTVTPSDPGKNTPVVYNKKDASLIVKYVDQDSNNAVLETKDLSGKFGDKITYTTADTIKSLEAKGYVLVSDGYTGKVGSEFDNTNNGQTYVVVFKHGTTTVTPDTPQKPDTPINPNDPNSPKYTEDQTDVTKDASQTVHYTGAGDKTPSDKVQTQKNAFTRTVTIDKVTGKTVSATPWTGSKTFGTETTPVVDGYHADKKVAGGLTATPENPNVEDTVTYAANGKIIPVDPNGNKIPDVLNPTYPTDPTDPTKVTPDEPVPDIPGYTPEVPTVTPSDPGKDTPVVYYTSPAAIVNFIDEDYVNAQGKKVPTQIGTSGGLTGKIGETIIYSGYDAKLQSYLDKGYVLDKSEYPTKDVYDNDDKTLQTFNVYLKHGTTTVTPDNPKNPNTPINPKDPDGPKYTEDQTKVKIPSTQTITYTGAGDKTPAKDVQTGEFDRTVTIDKVTGKTISSTPWTYTVNGKTTTGESLTYGTKDTPVVDGYHAGKKVAGGLTATPENPNVEDTVTYAANGKIIPVDPNGNKIPDAPTPTYPTDPTDPTKVVPDEPVPDIPGYTPETPTVTPENPGKNTNVPYTKNPTTPTEDKSSFKVVYVDQSDDGAVLKTDSESGKYGDQITYTTADTIKSLEDKGYVLVSDGFTGKAGSEFSDSNNGKTYTVVLKHGTTTVTPSNPQTPVQPINPNDPNGPKYTKDQTDVTRDATQTITYHYSDGSQPDTQTTSTEKNAFTRTVTVDKVTGKTISTTPWTGSHTFGKVDTPVIQGYHADKKTAGGLTATPDHPDVTDQVVYTPNGKIIPVDPNGNMIPNVPTPTYPTDPTDPTKVVPDEPVPTIPGYTPTVKTVTPTNPGEDTPVVYVQKVTPSEPVTPTTPKNPTSPTNPSAPVAEMPAKPNNQTGQVTTTPETEEQTTKQASPAPAKKLPQTGNETASGLVAAGLVGLLGSLGLGLKKKREH